MSADILSTPGFPHGTPDGFRAGCRGSHCPAVVACRVVHRRYQGDFRFRRLFDAGFSLERIAEVEEAEQVEAEVAARAARIAARAVKRVRQVKPSKPYVAPDLPGFTQLPPVKRGGGRTPGVWPHGTYQKWRQGCKTVEGCENPPGSTCLEAKRAYNRAIYANGGVEQQRQRRMRERQGTA